MRIAGACIWGRAIEAQAGAFVAGQTRGEEGVVEIVCHVGCLVEAVLS
jgi:hypothetical protein